MSADRPRVLVLSSLFPSPARPQAGLFIRERMFRVARTLPVTVVSPVPWFPGQSLLRRLRPDYRPPAPRHEVQDGIEVLRPRFLSVPLAGRWLDGLAMALGALPTLWRLRHRIDLIDAHFAYPDGYAGTVLGALLRRPVVITLRGTEVPLARTRLRRRLMARALRRADRVLSVSASLQALARTLGARPERTQVVANGVDTERFRPIDRAQARARLGLQAAAPVLVSVGALVERKGFHRVMACLPALRERFPDLQYLVVGGAGPEGDWEARLRETARSLGLADAVHFLGALPPERLREPLSAANVFVLATRNEGWANVFLEAMACGLPVVTTDVGGNAEVVSRADLGRIVPFEDEGALTAALGDALSTTWDRKAIRAHAEANGWDGRVAALVDILTEVAGGAGGMAVPAARGGAHG